jgi:hypothetical protein
MKKLRIFESEAELLGEFLNMRGDYSKYTRTAFYDWMSLVHGEKVSDKSEVVDGKIGGYDVRELMEKFNQSFMGVVGSTDIDMSNPGATFYTTLEKMPIFRMMVDESNYSREDIGQYFWDELFDFVESKFDGGRIIWTFCKIDFSKNMKELFDEITSAMEGKYPQQSQKGSYRYRY